MGQFLNNLLFYQVPDYGDIKKMYDEHQLCKYLFCVSEQYLLYCFCVCKGKFIVLINRDWSETGQRISADLRTLLLDFR